MRFPTIPTIPTIPTWAIPRWALVAALVLVISLTATASWAGTNLSVEHHDDGRIFIKSSSGRGAFLEPATNRQNGLMTSKQSKFTNQFMQQYADGVVVTGILVEGEQLTLTTSLGNQVVVPIVTPIPPQFSRLAIRSQDTTFDTTDVISESSTNVIPIPAIPGAWSATRSYLGFAVPDDQPDPGYASWSATCPGFGNFFGTLTEGAATFDHNGVTYKYWRFPTEQTDVASLNADNFCLGSTVFDDYP